MATENQNSETAVQKSQVKRDSSMVSCFNDNCLEEARFICNQCEGQFCWEHFQETHPKGVCIHY